MPDRDFVKVYVNGQPYLVPRRGHRRRLRPWWAWLPAVLIPLVALVATALKILGG